MVFKNSMLVAGAFSLCGCASLNGFTPTMASDTPLIGVEGQVLQMEMLSALEPVSAEEGGMNSYCTMLNTSFQERTSEQVKRYSSDGKISKKSPFGCFRYKKPEGDDVRNYVISGMALTDYYCDIFFDRIADRTARRKFARGGVNDVGAAISAILGLARAGSGITGGVGAGFGLLDSGIRNYDEAFTVDADLPSLQKLVRSEQKKIRDALFDGQKANGEVPSTYQEAAIEILRYANTCSFTGMRGLLTSTMMEKAAAQNNPLDGSRIFDFSTLSEQQRAAMLKVFAAQSELADANEAAAEEAEAQEADTAQTGDVVENGGGT